ncbi:hypothetical protein CKO27_22095 [Thiocystis violacea]|nr:hypothetical protein [Thiocystis violacea]
MDTGTAKVIEVVVIAALVLGFYFQQQAGLKRARTDEDRRDPELAGKTKNDDRIPAVNDDG